MKRLIAAVVTFAFLGLAAPAVFAEDAPKDDKKGAEGGEKKDAKKKKKEKEGGGW